LLQEGFEPFYEGTKYVIWQGFKPEIPFYKISKKTNKLTLQTSKIKDITYTPDFTVEYEDKILFIEAKGKQNDSYPIKRKLFLKHLESIPNAYFMEVYSKKDLVESLKQFDQYEQSKK
jgi:hypothetical protein